MTTLIQEKINKIDYVLMTSRQIKQSNPEQAEQVDLKVLEYLNDINSCETLEELEFEVSF